MVKLGKVGGILKEFKEFALKGNVLDLAVGVMIGGAFATITSSLIQDIVMPVVGMFLGGVDFSSWSIELPHLFGGAGEPILLKVGIFINTVASFLILAFVIFLIVKLINHARRSAEAALVRCPEPVAEPEPPAPDPQEVLLTEIRDLLKERLNEKEPD